MGRRLTPSIPAAAVLTSNRAITERHQRSPRRHNASQCNTKQPFHRMFHGGNAPRNASISTRNRNPSFARRTSDATKCDTKTAFPSHPNSERQDRPRAQHPSKTNRQPNDSKSLIRPWVRSFQTRFSPPQCTIPHNEAQLRRRQNRRLIGVYPRPSAANMPCLHPRPPHPLQ